MSLRRPAHNLEPDEVPSLAAVLQDYLRPGILVVDEQEQILCCTPEAERLLHLPPGQTVGCELSALPVAIRKITREAIASRQPVASRVITLVGGKDAPVFRVGVFPFQAPDGKTQTVITVNDAAMVGRIEQNLNRLDRLASVGTLSAGMAHEIKNALVAVRTFVELLLEKNRDDELGDIVGRELKRIETLLNQMLRFRASNHPASAGVRVHDVLEHSLRMLQHLFETKLITVHRRFNADCDTVKGDDYQLEQAFVNLFFNSLEAMGPNGALTVTSDNLEAGSPGQAARQLRITIADDGIGIAPENLDRLFEPFFTTKQNGTGLGMAITRRIIREHHGDITAQSKPNRGAKFSVLLPTHE